MKTSSDKLRTRPISGAPVSSTAAVAALGGLPARPPGSLRERKVAIGPGVVAPAAPSTAFPSPLGNPTFDGPPPELVARRAKAQQVRGSLAALAERVLSAHAELTPIIADLADDAEGVAAAEHFDCEVATKFLTDLKGVVDGLSSAPAEETAAPAAEAAADA